MARARKIRTTKITFRISWKTSTGRTRYMNRYVYGGMADMHALLLCWKTHDPSTNLVRVVSIEEILN